MRWITSDLDIKECVLEFAENENYKFQAEIVKLEPVFGTCIFGNFELNVSVFNLLGEHVDKFELNGLNGKFKAATKQLEILKEKALAKYN